MQENSVMNTSKITREAAEAEVTSWLDKKKIFPETRDKFKDHSELIVDAISNGALTLNPESFEFTHTLLFPIGENDGITEMKYKARLNDKQINQQMKGVKSDDVDGRVQALVAALTSQPRGIIERLDTADKRIATAIAVFFM